MREFAMIALPAEGVPETCMAGTFHSHGWVALVITIAGLVGAIYSLAMGFRWLREEADGKRAGTQPPDRRTAKNWLLGLWVLLPPAWLFVEYIFLYRHFGKPACFEQFKYAQELVGKGWAATVAVLSVLYFGKEILGKE
jgi:hypothetical protein